MSSLKDLARECGVSVATVSKALNGQSDISAATRDRVREAAMTYFQPAGWAMCPIWRPAQ